MNATASPLFIFNWDEPRRRKLAFTGLIAASFALHIMGFYLFQVIYPPTLSLVPPPQRINLMTANSEQTATLLRWIDAEDPALASTTRRPLHMQRHEMRRIEHIPSYFAIEPALKQVPPLVVDLRVPSAQPPGPVPMARRPVISAVAIEPTRVAFSDELRQLGQANLDTTGFKASSLEPPQNAQFRIAVDGRGAVRYCFILNSSGDPSLDQQAREHLALCRFPTSIGASGVQGWTSNADSLVWGLATIEWGNDVVTDNAKSTAGAP
jgi:hypothetical protein